MKIQGYAKFDSTEKYRYLLGRTWDDNLPQITFVMLNPSTAGAEDDDPTLTRCIRFAQSWDYGSLTVVNLFAYCATDPKELFQVNDPVGSENNSYIQSATQSAKEIIVAWGASDYLKKHRDRETEVLSLISVSGKTLYSLGDLTVDGHPGHPLYLPTSTQRKLFPVITDCNS
ncbi:DUF1643 domain-containing protein [Nodularia sp. NIES-3585]|uniref:DUF1643 domain-containing protein n=1 Tax=Nodularia sp. NIES-3585 TaxID=1973477 RepID=UPI000B5CC627|nr:DUF1643 domain-containing protein [Nodularia sp. NIES-3585]GAX36583.1 hypothetical protein NIES3585_26180 [Nodularia sp. NIES-3585]